ncbi:MAG: AIM24 family protein, partial [Candidatus Altiarchaeota archaeon]|nr:AIM24 family protein [Candidatus Altiarchaeota archaeon]
LSGITRKLSGESIFMTTYKAKGDARITFASEYIGKIVELNLQEGNSVICQKDAFMCAQEGVKLEMHMQKKIGAGLFGGEGFILQKVTGPGVAFLELGGEIVEKNLKQGEKLKVDPGYIGAFEPTVEYNIERIKGVKNMVFGGEGIFLATLKGPGKIWLQTMPLPSLADALLKYLPIPRSSG